MELSHLNFNQNILILLFVPIPYASTPNIQKYTLRRIKDLNNINFQWYRRIIFKTILTIIKHLYFT